MARQLISQLKRQLTTEGGRFEWFRHQFRLDIEGARIETLDDADAEPIELAGSARYAKEWALTSTIAGFGFDIVMEAGVILSFLASDEQTCTAWVESINASIALANGGGVGGGGGGGGEEEGVLGEGVDDEENNEGSEGEEDEPDDEDDNESDGDLSEGDYEVLGAAGAGGGAVARPPLYPTQSPGKGMAPSRGGSKVGTVGAWAEESRLASHSQDATLLVQQSPDVAQSRRPAAANTTTNRYLSSPQSAAQSPGSSAASTLSQSPSGVQGYGHASGGGGGRNPVQPGGSSTPNLRPRESGYSPSDHSSGNGQVQGHVGRPPAPAPLSSGLGLGLGLGLGYSHSNLTSLASSPHDRASDAGGASGGHGHGHGGILDEIGSGSLLSQGGSRSLLGGAGGGDLRGSATSLDAQLRRSQGQGQAGRASGERGGNAASAISSSLSSARDLLLEQQASRWQASAEREAAEGAIAREQLVRVSAELTARQQQHKIEMEQLMDRTTRQSEALQAEFDMRVLRASNEQSLFHGSALKAEREQSARELSCLRDELQAERKRYAALLQNETSMRDRAEGREVTLLAELAGLKEAVARATAEATRVRDTAAAEKAAFEREKKLIAADHTARVARHEQEAADAAAQAQSELRAKHAELQHNFDAKIREMETSIRATISSEAESNSLRSDALAKKRAAAEVEAARTDERKARAREVEQLRAGFREREKQTADDLAELELLHTERVQRLDAQNDALRVRVAEADKAAQKATASSARSADESRKAAALHLKTAETNARRANQLSEQLAAAQREAQESRVREGTYREQAGRALEEGRLARAESLEMRRQLQELHQQAQQWRRVAKESHSSTTTSTSSLAIMRDEISMLEHELRRYKTENAVLLESLQRAEKLVYGTVGTGGASLGSGVGSAAFTVGYDENRGPNGGNAVSGRAARTAGSRPVSQPNPNPYEGHHGAVGDAVLERTAGVSRRKGVGVSGAVRRIGGGSGARPGAAGLQQHGTHIKSAQRSKASKSLAPSWGANLPSR